jgi:hypothetical protein
VGAQDLGSLVVLLYGGRPVRLRFIRRSVRGGAEGDFDFNKELADLEASLAANNHRRINGLTARETAAGTEAAALREALGGRCCRGRRTSSFL